MCPRRLSESESEPESADLFVAVEIVTSVARVEEPDSAIRHGVARLVDLDDEGRVIKEFARLRFDQIEYGYGQSHGIAAIDIVDAHSQTFLDLHSALFDEDGELRARFGDIARLDPDLLVIDRIEVEAHDRFQSRAEELLEHVLRRWSYGCFAAVYVEDPDGDPELASLLSSRGFRRHEVDGVATFICALADVRPLLCGEQATRKRPASADDSSLH
jgi:hypothetical protein